MILNETKDEIKNCPCKVCGNKAHGIHFGVISCRACAAFFRRFIVLNLEYVCLKDPEKCDVDINRRNSCRHCRFQKCLTVGMTTDNVQFNRDVYLYDKEGRKPKKKTSKSTSSCSVEVIEVIEEVPSTSLQNMEVVLQENVYRATVLEECKNIDIRVKCEKIFQSGYPNIYEDLGNMNFLEKVAFGLEKLRADQEVIDINFDNRLSYDNLVPHWASVSTKLANLFMHSWAFRNIHPYEQTRIFRYVWKTLYRLERLQMTVKIFGEKCVDEKKIIINCKRAIQLDALFMDIEGISREKKKFTLTEYKKYAHRLIDEIAKPLCKLDLSTIEVAYMLCICCQYNEEYFFGNNVTPVTDVFQDQIGENLHEYYKSIGIINYAPRVKLIMSIIINMKRIHYDDFLGNLVYPPGIFDIEKCTHQ
ncbi:unnamed protein product [Caenorhabditis angaria]|uniref:Nuclear receptor domain-containing protein n=1 Tax=Caenorhabditis angaria TaxID=860376 RepID=A0A9P1IVE2_9PELO|nr:unnamed protein product [Caenorhabditis angaria]